MTKLVLFDIDGTLITRCLIHEEAFSVGFKVLNIDADIREFPCAGRTDKWIIMEVLKKKGISKKQISDNIRKVYEEMINYMRERIKKDNSFSIIPGVKKLLENIEKRGHFMGLVTGNIEEIAILKLQKTGISSFFLFGGFGDISEDKGDLIEIAIKNAENKIGIKFNKNDVIIIGDTPIDVECGKKSGIKTIAMATGPYSFEELEKCNPDFLFKDYRNISSIIKAIES